MNKKIKTEVAIGTILVIAFLLGGALLLTSTEKTAGIVPKDEKTKLNETANTNKGEGSMSGKKCRISQNDGPADAILEEYVVKKGDTLFLIAKSQLGDVSRAGELAQLNKLRYPGLSLQKSSIEVGWRMALPPKDILTSGDLSMTSGKLTRIYEDLGKERWVIDNTIHFWIEGGDVIEDNISVGDCINSVYDKGFKKKILINLQK